MEATGTNSKLIVAVGQLFTSVKQDLSSAAAFRSLARELGWNMPTVPAPVQQLLPLVRQLDADLTSALATPTLATITQLKTSVSAVFQGIKNLATATYPATYPVAFDSTEFKQEFPNQLLNHLIIRFLEREYSAAYGALSATGFINQELVAATPTRPSYLHRTFTLSKLADLLADPGTFWKLIYGGGNTELLYDKLVLVLGELFLRLGFSTVLRPVDYSALLALNPTQLPDAVPDTTTVAVKLIQIITDTAKFSADVSLVPLLAAAGDHYEGVALVLQATGTLADKLPVSDEYDLAIMGAANLAAGVGVQLRPGQALGVAGLGTAASTISSSLELALQPAKTVTTTDKHLLLRTPGNTELTYESITWKAGVAYVSAVADIYTELRINALRFASGEGDNDSFLSQILKNFYFKTDLSIGLSKDRGFYFDASGGLSTKQIKTIKLGPVQLNSVAFAVATDPATSFTYLTVVSDLVADLGPIKASLSGVGLKAGLKYDANGGDIGPFSTDIAVKGPSGVGIAVESDLVTGGGYLFLDPAHHKYAGVATLQLKLGKTDINLNALGLLQTELPDNPDAYSLLLLITATFTPIQLGLGFSLNGLGGLAGVNRVADLDYLRGVVRNGQLDTLLFPSNVMNDPTAALTIVDAAYPAAEGRYLIGLMGRVGWGTPTLLTLDLALILELPAPLRIIMLGVLQASLPSKTNELLKLRADFLGYVDFGAKTAAFDASLTQSKLLMFSLTGDMAFRLYQGGNPLFVITAGGFHPAFQPPAGTGLTGLRRLTLALSQGNDLRLTLASYFAVTANTVQFGSRLDLAMRIGLGLRAEGYFSFDVLFQFSPFRVLAHVEAGVSILSGNRELLGLHLSLDVTGPGPWHIWGDASFRIWFVRVSVGVNATIGQAPAQPQLPAPDVHSLLKPALEDAGSWQVEAPATQAAPGGVVMRPVSATAGQLFLDPRATLVLRQRVAPLGLTLDKYGSGPTLPVNGRRFDLSELTLNGQGGTPAPAADVEVVRDFFAPDQFVALTDAQRLSLPSFQLLPSGLRLKRLTSLKGATAATRRVVRYEYKSLGSSPQRIQRPLGTGQFGQFQQLLKGGALGRAVAAEQPAARAAQPVGWAEDSYAVVHATDLSYYADAINPAYNYVHDFATQLEAEQARQALVQARPNLAAEVMVVPSYERATV